MRTAYFVSGIVLLVLGTGLGLLAFGWLAGSCTDAPGMARFLGVPTCSQLLTQIFAVGGGGLLSQIIGFVLFWKGARGGVP